VIISGHEIAQHQQRVGQFNYLVGPLRGKQPITEKAPFLVLIRPEEWQEFTADDRVLLQAVCLLWSRGKAKASQVQELRDENALLKKKIDSPTLLGSSAMMESLRAQTRKLAALNVTVLLQGETGSGKEVVAQFLHETSARRAGPFIKVNCAAIPESLFESELFGHVKGAFTDARANRTGKFVQADGGTLFLDEVGEIPLGVQAKLLRAIEAGEVEPLGSEAVSNVNVRIIAATHRNLEEMVRQRQFREDLFYRLNVLNIRVPALREHVGDIDELAPYFLGRFCTESGLPTMEFAPQSLEKLKEYRWSGNVRELRSIVQRCALAAVPPLISETIVSEQLPAGYTTQPT
jgi:transcriptional regulator with GAF, ATPase, and Fis domain